MTNPTAKKARKIRAFFHFSKFCIPESIIFAGFSGIHVFAQNLSTSSLPLSD